MRRDAAAHKYVHGHAVHAAPTVFGGVKEIIAYHDELDQEAKECGESQNL